MAWNAAKAQALVLERRAARRAAGIASLTPAEWAVLAALRAGTDPKALSRKTITKLTRYGLWKDD